MKRFETPPLFELPAPGVKPDDPAWHIFVALGLGMSEEQLKKQLLVGGIRNVSAREVIETAKAGNLATLRGNTVIWRANSLHQETLRIVNSPVALRALNLERSLWSHDTLSLTNSLRWCVYLNKVETLVRLLRDSMAQGKPQTLWLQAFLYNLDFAWFQTRDLRIQQLMMEQMLPMWLVLGVDVSPLKGETGAPPSVPLKGETVPPPSVPLKGETGLLAFVEKTSEQWPQVALELAVAQGQLERAQAILEQNKALQGAGYPELLLLLNGQAEEAHRGFQKRVLKRKQNTYVFSSLPALFARLAALRVGDLKATQDTRYLSGNYPNADRLLQYVGRALEQADFGNVFAQLDIFNDPSIGLELCLVTAVESALPTAWVPDRKELRSRARAQLEAQGLYGFAAQMVEANPAERSETHWGHGLYRQEPWEFILSSIRMRGLDAVTIAPPKRESEYRLSWHLIPPYGVEVLKQKLGKQGWNTGTTISWKTLLDSPPDFLSEQDRVAIGKLFRTSRGHWAEYVLNAAFFKALLGHPNLLYYNQPCHLVELPLQIHLDETDQRIVVDVHPKLGAAEYCLIPGAPGEIGLCAPEPDQLQLLKLLPEPLKLPPQARERLIESLQPWMDRLEVTYAEGVEPLVPTQEADSQVIVQLHPYRQGLRVILWVRPLGEEGPLLKPGQGPPQESLRWKDQTILIRRNMMAEESARASLLKACPGLFDSDSQEFPETEEALEILLQLQKSQVRIEWPEHKSWNVRTAVGSNQLSVKAESAQGWFEIQGQLRVDDQVVVELGRLLELTRTAQGRFIALEDGQFLALTEDLKQKLTALDELVDTHKKQLRLSPLAVPSLAELDSSIEGDQAFIEALERFRSADAYLPQLPRALQAELRDYQVEGFRWMAQRARAEAGACLADDMGLGKTVQTIALLLQECKEGPHLVLCPTSVTSNWSDQMRRFAPDLRPVYLEGKGRAQQLAELRPGDVVICSYRILLQDRLDLKEVMWNAVVLDEAQFIKNPESKTARASYELQARIRIATTGTPIENRLSELWSIFRFLNPGLLGTLVSFRRRFEAPVLAGQSGPRHRLRRLVSPFILRRTKSQVLDELPSRTEISLTVELSTQERALYEDVRRRAEKGLSSKAGHIELLAQLTRLRQACCHPQLLLPQETFPSSKFEAFFGLAEELLGGRHRTLVFSQFVELLKLLEGQLKQRGMNYLYLDGSTPVAQRRERVDAFQAGEGDFFLISLKAGGTGLNLTGADYVVHLDPWWNPAVEDQASDRAHRIGQTRPVTIYRLIAKDTIEEKVVNLHGLKRELAQGILEGADGTTSLSAEDLLDLLKG